MDPKVRAFDAQAERLVCSVAHGSAHCVTALAGTGSDGLLVGCADGAVRSASDKVYVYQAFFFVQKLESFRSWKMRKSCRSRTN